MLAVVDTNKGGGATGADRRSGVRQRLLLRTGKLRCRSGEYPCVIHDVSETGARLRLFHAHPPDRHMWLELANGQFYAIERRWIDGPFAGCMFSSQVAPDQFVHEANARRRRPLRVRLTSPVQISAAGQAGHAMMVDLSQNGACIEAGRQLPVGSPLRIDILGSAPRFAHVSWRQEYRHGLAFQEVFTLKDFAQLAYFLQPYGAEPATEAGKPPQVLSA